MSGHLRIGVAGAGLIGRRHIELIGASADCGIADPSVEAVHEAARTGARVSTGQIMEQAA